MALKDQCYSPEELAEYLDVPVKTIYQWNHKGTGPKFSRVGVHVRYRPEHVQAWLDERTVQTGVAA